MEEEFDNHESETEEFDCLCEIHYHLVELSLRHVLKKNFVSQGTGIGNVFVFRVSGIFSYLLCFLFEKAIWKFPSRPSPFFFASMPAKRLTDVGIRIVRLFDVRQGFTRLTTHYL